MYLHWTVHISQFPIGSLDLINGHPLRLVDNAVRPALQHQPVVRRGVDIAQGHLGLVLTAHTALNHAVDPAPLLHGLFGGGMVPVVDISAAQNELHQFPDGDADFLRNLLWFLRCCCLLLCCRSLSARFILSGHYASSPKV